MKTTLLFIAALAILFAGCRNSSAQKINEFEGIIIYKHTYKNYTDSALYGDTLKMYYSRGRILKTYNGKAPGGLKKELYYGDNPAYYFERIGIDTLFTYDMKSTGNYALTKFIQGKHPDKILGYPCESIKTTHVFLSDVSFYQYETHVYSKECLKVDPAHFEDFKFMNFNKVLDESGTFFLRYEANVKWDEKKDFGTHIIEAVKIIPGKLDQSLFDLPHLPQKEFKIE